MNDVDRGPAVDVGAASSSEANTLEITACDENRTPPTSPTLTTVQSDRTLRSVSSRDFYLSVLRGEQGSDRRPRSSEPAQTASLLFLSLSADATGLVTATYDQIAEGILLSARAVKVAVGVLVEIGSVKVVRRQYGTIGAIYQVPVPPAAEKA